jgi:hypothetical protein
MQRKMTGQNRDSSRLLIPRQISSFVFTLTIDLTPLWGALTPKNRLLSLFAQLAQLAPGWITRL